MYPGSTQKLLDHLPALAGIVRRAALDAGAAIMDHYEPSGFQGVVDLKADDSPVTIADRLADEIIRAALHRDVPGIPMITEETVDQTDVAAVAASRYYWLVDGLDGTKAFRKGDPDFTVNIALIDGDAPILGVIYAPAHGEGYVGVVGVGAMRFIDDEPRDRDIQVRSVPVEGLTLLTSTSTLSATTQQIVERVKLKRHLKRHSSIKYCEVARGAADAVVAVRDVFYWDSAAGDALIRAAGGLAVDAAGDVLRYDRTREGYCNHGVVACADADYMIPVLHDIQNIPVDTPA